MKVLFSNPPWWDVDLKTQQLLIGVRAGSRWPFTRYSVHAPGEFRHGGYLPFPFFLGSAAARTKATLPDATIEMRDSIARGESYQQFFDAVLADPPDWVVLETATAAWVHDEKVIDWFAAMTKAQIILCGPLDISKADEILGRHRNIAAIVQGEYDKQVLRVIRGQRGVIAHDLLTVGEMDNLPYPIHDEVAVGNYWDACPKGQTAPQLQLITSRGCPYKCIFCVWPAVMTGNDPDGTRARTVRCHSPEWVRGAIKTQIDDAWAKGVRYKSIYLDDDTFNLTEKHTRQISQVMKEFGLPWFAMCRADTVKEETWKLMLECGCKGVKLGFESGSQTVIDKIINKRLNLAKAADTARMLRNMGMSVHGTFTVGLPGETKQQQQETLDYIKMLYETGGLDTHQLSGTAEIEGTPLHTLKVTGSLEKYASAKIDDAYVANPDGAAKLREMKL